MKTLFYSIIVVGGLLLVKIPVTGQVIPAYLKGYEKEFIRDPRQANMSWFKNARFGMFIHFGLYSQLGKGEWVLLSDKIPLDDYDTLKECFTAENFDAEFIVKLAKKAGMKYITFTSKHCESFSLFNTRQSDFNSVQSPAGRDLVKELADACEKEGLGLFLYYSYAADWRHPYFYSNEDGWNRARPDYEVYPERYLYQQPDDFREYIDFAHAQLTELLTQYPMIAGIWLDPIMGYYANPDVFPIEETYLLIRSLSPHALISFKQGANGTEDFVAPERANSAKVGEAFPAAQKASLLNKGKYTEVCHTMQKHPPEGYVGHMWGYNKAADGNHLTIEEVKDLLKEAEEGNYNLLLNIGPLPDGSVHPEDIRTLNNLWEN